MKYARIENGKVMELFETDGDITTMFHPSYVWVDITDVVPQPGDNWTYVDGVFAAPVPPPVTLGDNQATKSALMAAATEAIAPLQDAVDLGIATTAEEALLLKWKQYRVTLNRLVMKDGAITWPKTPA